MARHFDPKTQFGGGVSIQPGTNVAATASANGDGVDCGEFHGPVWADCAVGSATGTPTSQTSTFKLQESTTSGGTYTDLATKTDAVITADKKHAWAFGVRTMEFVRVVVTNNLVAGTAPTIDTGATVHSQKIHA